MEREELGIAAGMQDRVVQTYEGIVYMDFDRRLMESRGYGDYEELRPSRMPAALYRLRSQLGRDQRHSASQSCAPCLTAATRRSSEAMQKFRDLTDRGRDALMAGDWHQLHQIMNANFDLRRTIMPIAPENLRMIEAARGVGASAKFAGSGGAIIGLYHGARQYQELVDALAALRCVVLRPAIFET